MFAECFMSQHLSWNKGDTNALEVTCNVEYCFLGSGAMQFGINLPIFSGTYFLRLQRGRGTVKMEAAQHSATSLIFF